MGLGSSRRREPGGGGADGASARIVPDSGPLCVRVKLPRKRGWLTPEGEMRMVHVITRLILGGAQENTLLTVEGLHHHYRDDVTLITGPAEGPEGDLFVRASEQGLDVEVMSELVRP